MKDGQDEQSEVLFDVHALVDTLYIKELGKKTHPGARRTCTARFSYGRQLLWVSQRASRGRSKAGSQRERSNDNPAHFRNGSQWLLFEKDRQNTQSRKDFTSAPEGQEGKLDMVSYRHPRDAQTRNVCGARYLEPLQIRKIAPQ